MNMNRLIVIAVMCTGVACLIPPAGQAADSAEAILAATGVQGGLIVHLGCGDGRLYPSLTDGSIMCFGST